jgi:hypothetical protein
VDYVETDPIHNWGYGNLNAAYGNSLVLILNWMTILSDGAVSACCWITKRFIISAMLPTGPAGYFQRSSGHGVPGSHLARQRNT